MRTKEKVRKKMRNGDIAESVMMLASNLTYLSLDKKCRSRYSKPEKNIYKTRGRFIRAKIQTFTTG